MLRDPTGRGHRGRGGGRRGRVRGSTPASRWPVTGGLGTPDAGLQPVDARCADGRADACPRERGGPGRALGRVGAGALLVMIDRHDYYQCGYVNPKGGYAKVTADGLDGFRHGCRARPEERAGRQSPPGAGALLTVQVNRLDVARARRAVIGDAAHAMSPSAASAVNLAVQDASPQPGCSARSCRRLAPEDLDLVASAACSRPG